MKDVRMITNFKQEEQEEQTTVALFKSVWFAPSKLSQR